MKLLLGLLILIGQIISFAGCTTSVEKGDEQRLAGNYQEAIKFYLQVKPGDKEYTQAIKGLDDIYFEMGEKEFNTKNWQEAIAIFQKVKYKIEAKERINTCYFELGEVEFNKKNWQAAIPLYEKINTNKAKERLKICREKRNAELREIEEKRLAGSILNKAHIDAENGFIDIDHETISDKFGELGMFWGTYSSGLRVYSNSNEATKELRGKVCLTLCMVVRIQGQDHGACNMIELDNQAIQQLQSQTKKFQEWQKKARDLKVEPMGKSLGTFGVRMFDYDATNPRWRTVKTSYLSSEKGLELNGLSEKYRVSPSGINSLYICLKNSVISEMRERLSREISELREKKKSENAKQIEKARLLKEEFR